MLEEEGFVDVTLAADGKCLKAHKIMLSACSPFFKKIFQMNPCQHPVIVLQDVHFSALESILKFIYKGEVCILQENLPLLLRAAETLQIRGLCKQLKDEESNSQIFNGDKELNEKSGIINSPQSSSKISKKVKNQGVKSGVVPCFFSQSSIKSPEDSTTDCEKVKLEPRSESPAVLDDNYVYSLGLTNNSQIERIEADDENGSTNYPFSPFPCPFCDRAYSRWGFRRRHIKACHTRSKSLPCKWCLKVLPTHREWESHVCCKHRLSRNDAKNGLLILEEAKVVLQIPEPSRLDELVSMIKNQNRAMDEISKMDEDNDENKVEISEEEVNQKW
ncbi:bric-A-brac, putative [Pediculus humanus corporis]|uniref:Bric-A-brac, putative n=1 Tax=Pediculus humanus subsp. corporis TaxID=121224 RepID=E0VF93_PEDHC|nr:bric-A-brac, putative [Pediculus humanus corporis]EEB12049.1 bric-A-brac, putative [Pediculus humanus corporis]